jgi:hypothetical protein
MMRRVGRHAFAHKNAKAHVPLRRNYGGSHCNFRGNSWVGAPSWHITRPAAPHATWPARLRLR